jgi:hypothetical protein
MAANFGTADGGNFAAQPASRPQGMATLLNLPSNAAWWYTHHPAHWQCVDGEWLPDLGQMVAIPGLNRVDKNGDTALAEVHLGKKGVTIIPWEVEPGGYCIQYAGANGPVFLSKWEKPKLVAGQTRMSTDQEGYRAFIRRLVADGIIKIPDPDFIGVIIERQERIVSEHQTRAPTHPGSALALPVEQKRLEDMRAARERMYTPVKSTKAKA